jgi:UDP-glucuronate decarboxylase
VLVTGGAGFLGSHLCERLLERGCEVICADNFLGLAKRVGAKILQASTSEVYGDPSVHPQREDYWGNVNPIGSRACYDEGKRCAETLFFDYRRQYQLRNTPDEVAGPVNIGNPVESTIRELAELVVAMTGSASKIVFRPLPEDDPMQRCPDISRARELLGWQPQVALREGLQATIDYFDRHLSSGPASPHLGRGT